MDTMRLEDIDLIDGSNFVAGVPFEWFRQLRHEAPVYIPRSMPDHSSESLER